MQFLIRILGNKHQQADYSESTATLAETFIQFTEYNGIHDSLIKHKIVGYFTYVHDVLLIYNEELANINLTL
jgi:hypothetical protein